MAKTTPADKRAFRSKTIGVGIAQLVLGTADVLIGGVECTLMKGEIPAGWLLIIFGGIHIVLRFFTHSKVRVK